MSSKCTKCGESYLAAGEDDGLCPAHTMARLIGERMTEIVHVLEARIHGLARTGVLSQPVFLAALRDEFEHVVSAAQAHGPVQKG